MRWWDDVRLPVAHVGVLLQLLREDRRMSLQAMPSVVVACGYDELSVAMYARLEAGIYLPEDAEAFLDAYTQAVQISHQELLLVVAQWGYDLLKRDMGEKVALEILRSKLTAGVPRL